MVEEGEEEGGGGREGGRERKKGVREGKTKEIKEAK
jgi:hypothetical protein